MEGLIPRLGGVYAWRRSTHPPPGVLKSPSATREWVERSVGIPFATVGPMRLAHFCQLKGLVLGGGGLGGDKGDTLDLLVKNPKGRALIGDFLQSLQVLTPPLYVGEAMDLVTRAHDHLTYKTDFSVNLRDGMGMSWTEVEFCYWAFAPIPAEAEEAADNSKRVRTLLELVATRMTFAGSVQRPG